MNSAIKNLNELIYVDEQNSGLILVSVNMEEPQLAADIANYISQYVVDFVKVSKKVSLINLGILLMKDYPLRRKI